MSKTAVNQSLLSFGPMNAVWLFLRLPALLRIVWLTLLAGMVLVFLGYLRWSEWKSWTGIVLLVAGLILTALDFVYRKRQRERLAEFMTALIMSLLSALFGAFASLAIFVLFFLAKSFWYGPDWALAARLLHFAAVLFVIFFVAMIPAAVRKTLERTAKRLTSSLVPGAEGGKSPSGARS